MSNLVPDSALRAAQQSSMAYPSWAMGDLLDAAAPHIIAAELERLVPLMYADYDLDTLEARMAELRGNSNG